MCSYPLLQWTKPLLYKNVIKLCHEDLGSIYSLTRVELYRRNRADSNAFIFSLYYGNTWVFAWYCTGNLPPLASVILWLTSCTKEDSCNWKFFLLSLWFPLKLLCCVCVCVCVWLYQCTCVWVGKARWVGGDEFGLKICDSEDFLGAPQGLVLWD